MTHAEVCPVCGGSGQVNKEAQAWTNSTTDATFKTTCHGCGGRGWVVVGSKKSRVKCEPVWVIDFGQYSDDGLPMVRNNV